MNKRGKPVGYFETGFEGTVWCVVRPGHHPVELQISRDLNTKIAVYYQGQELWRGLLEMRAPFELKKTHPLMKAYFKNYPANPTLGQFNLLGRWVHSLPENFDLALWAMMFLQDFEGYEIEVLE